jgi:AcrR family transcriptional regulator
MTERKPSPAPLRARGEPVRLRVIEAAEQLLRRGKAEFSMRELAAEADVSFATPFNQFGSKHAVMLALSGRRIDEMQSRYLALPPAGDAPARILAAVDMAAAVMLEAPQVNRAVMGWLGAASDAPGAVLAHSATLWALALGAGDGLRADCRARALRDLPTQLAFAFRGVLSFWTAGELSDERLAFSARDMARALLSGLEERPA